MRRPLFVVLSVAVFSFAGCIRWVAPETDRKLAAAERDDCNIVRRNPLDGGAHVLGDRELALGAARDIEAARRDFGTSDAGADGGDPCK